MNEHEVLMFTNISEEDFIGLWDSHEYTVKAGETKPYPYFLAVHFAKHLINKLIIDNEGVARLSDEGLRNSYANKVLSGGSFGGDLNDEPVAKGQEVAKAVEKLQEKIALEEDKAFEELKSLKPKKPTKKVVSKKAPAKKGKK